MGTLVILDFEGLTSGVTATAAAAGVTTVTISSGNSMLGRNAALVGATCIEMNVNSANACVAEQTLPLNNKTLYRFDIPIFVPATPVAVNNSTIWQIYGGASGTTVVARIQLSTSNTLTLSDTSGAHTSSSIDLSPYAGTWVSIRGWLNAGTTTSDGSAKLRIYPDPRSAAAGAYIGPGGASTEVSVTNWNLGAGLPFITHRFGFQTSQGAGNPRQLRFDYIRLEDLTTASFFDGVPAATAPSVSAAVSDAYPAAGATITLTSTESGTFTSATWSCTAQPPESATPSIASPSSASTSVLVTSPGWNVFRRRLVWSGGNQDSSVTVYVHAGAGQRAGLYATSGTWSNVGGATDRRTAYTDGSDTTYGQSSDNPPSTDIETITLNPCDLGPIKLYIRDRWSGGTGTSVAVTLYKEDGTTVVDSWSYNPSTSFADVTPLDVDSTGLAAIPTRADRRALVVKIAPTA